MPNTYIKDSGDWELVQRPWVKVGGQWKPVKKIWVKTDVPQVPTPAVRTVTESFKTPGTIDWKVPLTLVNNSIKVTMVGGGGGGGGGGFGSGGETGGSGCGGGSGYALKNQVISVTPGETLSLVIGKGGSAGISHYSRTSRPGFPAEQIYSGSAGFPTKIFRLGNQLLSVIGGNGGALGVENASQPGYSPIGGSGYRTGGAGTFVSSGTVPGGNGGDSQLAAGAIGIASTKSNAPNGSLGSGGAGGAASDSPDAAADGGRGGDGAILITYDETFLGPPPHPWRQVFGNTGTELYDTPGTYSFTVPPGVYSITVGGRKAFGNIGSIIGGTKLNVVPKDVISVFVGVPGEGASFGSVTYGSGFFTQTVIYHRGYVDRYLRQTINIVTPNGEPYASAPYNGLVYPTAGRDDIKTIAAQAAAKGITITTELENSWGDLAQEITVDPVLNDGNLPNNIIASVNKIAGRGTVTIEQQPNAANGYKVRVLVDDNAPSAADYYEYSVTIDAQPYISISY